MYSWLQNKNISTSWRSYDFNSIRTLYDNKNKDIYFTVNDEALAYSELSGSFTSRYSYGRVGWLISLGEDTFQIKNSNYNDSIWKLHGGEDYNHFFDETNNNPSEYSIEYIVNETFPLDKIFDTVELFTNDTFVADRTGTEFPFHTLDATTNYQASQSNVSKLKKKFRIWRWEIGRNNVGIKSKNILPSRDRIRDAWVKLKLTGNQCKKIQLYNTSVVYYV
jgi:hypothetical protein